jgi:hypothetical protein
VTAPSSAHCRLASERPHVTAGRFALAKEIHAERDRARQLGLHDDELAFYDAVATNDSAVQELGSNQLAVIARDLATGSSVRCSPRARGRT